jgi:hypothetical protein
MMVVVAVVVVVMVVMVIVAVIAAMAMIMVMMMGIMIGSGITSMADSRRSNMVIASNGAVGSEALIRMEHSLPSSRLWAVAAWARRSYGDVDAAVLVRRNHDVAPKLEYCVSLCFNCAYRCFTASMPTHAT